MRVINKDEPVIPALLTCRLFVLVKHVRRPDYQHSKDFLKFLLGTMAITDQQMCPQAPFSVIQCTQSQPRHSNPICVTVMHKAHTAQRPSLCPPPTSSVVPTASSDQTPPRRCPPNVSVPDHLYAPSTLYVQWVGPARNRPRRLFVLLRFLSNQPLAILSRSCSQISSADETQGQDFSLSVCTPSFKDLEASSKD